jgi:predicted dehydrogenase
MIKVGIIGYGYWGPNLVRNFCNHPGCEVKYVADLRIDRLEQLTRTYPGIKVIDDYKTILSDPSIDAVVIAVPVFLHYAMAKEALLNGKHVLVEKPITTSLKEAEDLIDIALKQKKVLMVDHTFLYTPAVQKIKSIVDSGDIGSVKYFDSVRINLGLFQPDINVIWDLAPHDISILDYLIPEKPVSVHATGISHTQNKLENIAYITVNYQSDFIAHFSCSWTSPVKIRKILIGGDKKMIVFDDVEPTEKVKIYNTSYSLTSDEDKRKILVDYRSGDIYIPRIEQKEALAGIVNDFIQAIEKGGKLIADAESGLRVVRILEAANASIKQKGKEIKL